MFKNGLDNPCSNVSFACWFTNFVHLDIIEIMMNLKTILTLEIYLQLSSFVSIDNEYMCHNLAISIASIWKKKIILYFYQNY